MTLLTEMTLNDATLAAPPERVAGAALFLDLDGVLAPLAATPDAVGPEPRRTRVLGGLIPRLGGRVAVISGREIAEIDRILDGAAPLASGVHGLQRRGPDGRIAVAPAAEGVAEAAAAFRAFAEGRPGILVEDKGVATGLHYRQAPEHAEAAQALARDLAERHGLAHQPGALIEELKTPGSDKGRALEAFMSEPPFRGSVPIMLGDDLTDEYGFRAAERLGGFGVLVGPVRATAARHGLSGPDAVLDWLERFQAD